MKLKSFALALVFVAQPGFAQQIMRGGIENPGYLVLKANTPYDKLILNGSSQHQSGKVDEKLFEHRTYSRILRDEFISPTGQFRIDSIQAKLDGLRKDEKTFFRVSICGDALEEYNSKNANNRISAYTCPSITNEIFSGKGTGIAELDKTLKKKFKEDTTLLAYRVAEEKLGNAFALAQELNSRRYFVKSGSELNTQGVQPFLNELLQGLEISNAIQALDSDGKNLELVKNMGRQFLDTVVIADRPENEASNLDFARTADASFNAIRSVSPMVMRDDVSRHDPAGSLVWHRRDVKNFDTINYNNANMKDEALHVPAEMLDQNAVISVTFYKGAHHGRTAKMDVKASDGKTYKMKVTTPDAGPETQANPFLAFEAMFANRSEVHTQTAANNLAAALGFNVKPTYYKENVRLYFANDGFGTADHANTFDKVRKALVKDLMTDDENDVKVIAGIAMSNPDRDIFASKHNYAAILGDDSVRTDEKGRKYILIKEASFQSKWDKNEFSAGPFERSSFNKEFFRDHRALSLFAMLVADGDTKADNTDVMLKNMNPEGKPSYQMMYVPTDMGATFGWAMGKELVNTYGWDFVNRAKSVPGKKIVLNFRTTRWNPIFSAITMNDARWFARLVGQLSREQIVRAFEGAGYKHPVSDLFAEKFMKRRDDLVEFTQATDVIPQKLSTVTDPKLFTVKGFEKYIKDGELVAAPEGVEPKQTFSVHNRGEGTPFNNVAKAAAAPLVAMGVDAGERNLEHVDVFEKVGELSDAKAEAGFISLIPARYFISNGNNTDRPWLQVDVYRVGLGAKAKEVWDFINGQTPQGKLEVGFVKELIRLRPVASKNVAPLTALKFSANPKNYFKTALEGLTRAMVTSGEFQPGDILVQNGYASLGPIFNSKPGFFSAGPNVSGGVIWAKINEVTLAKTGANEIVANWRNALDTKFKADAGLKLVFFKLNAVELKDEVFKAHDLAYKFNMADGAQAEALLSNLHAHMPRFKVRPEFELDRDTVKKTGTLVLSAFGIATASKSNVDLNVVERDENGAINKELHEKVSQLRKRMFTFHGRLNHDDKLVRVKRIQTSSANSVNLSFEFNYDKAYATVKDYKGLYLNAVALMTPKMQAYTPDTVSPLLGHLTFKGSIEFRESALNDILGHGRSKEEACAAYYSRLPVTIVHEDGSQWTAAEWCNVVFPKDGIEAPSDHLNFVKTHNIVPADKSDEIATAFYETRRFVSKFLDAQSKYNGFRSRDGHVSSSAVAAIQNLGKGSSDLKTLIATLEGLVDKGQVVRTASLKSSIDAFGTGEVAVKAQDQRGQYVKETKDEMTTALVDAVSEKIKNVTYDEYRVGTHQGLAPVDLHDAPLK